MKTIARRFPWTVRLLALTAVLMLTSYRSWSQASNGPCGQTRHEYIEAGSMHYLPGEPVTITGNGFAPSCDVMMAANVPDGTIEYGAASTDAAGNLTYTYLLGSITGDYSIQAETTDGAISLATAPFSSGIYVMTDKTDYQPGDSVTFSGRGFGPGETISLTIRQTWPGGLGDTHLSVVADGSGAFFNSDLFMDEQDLNTALSVTATGQSSGRSAEAEFHDALTFVAGQKTVNSTTAVTAASINAVYAAGPTSGNLLVAIVGAFGNGTAITAPGGWSTARNEAGTATSPAQAIFYKISAGAGDNSVTAGLSPSTTGTITIQEFSGVQTSPDPFELANSTTGTTSPSSTGTLTVTATDLLVGGVSAESVSANLLMNGAAANGYTKEIPIATVAGGAAGAQRIASQSADRKGSAPAGDSTGFAITGTPILGWRGQIAAFKAKLDTTTVITASPASPAISGSSVTFTATISPSGTSGTVTFLDNATTLCAAAPVVSNVATCGPFTLTTATHPIKATYNGDGAFLASPQATLSYVVSAAATSDCFRSNVASGNWGAAGSWQEAKPVGGACPTDPAAWVTASAAPTSAATGIEIRSGHTITVSAPATAANLTVDSGGDIEIAASNSLSISSGATLDMLINGTVNIFGTLTRGISVTSEVGGTGTLTVKSGGLINGGGGNGATTTHLDVDSGGQWTINAGGSYNPSGTNAINVKSGGSATLNGPVTAGDVVTFDGTVISSSTITGSNALAVGGNATFGGAVTINGTGSLNVTGTATSSANITLASVSNLQISGTLTMTAGTLTVGSGNGTGTGSITSGGSLILIGSSVFAMNSVATSTYTVASGGTLDMGPSAIVNGSGPLTVASGANLKIGSVDGITTGATGNVQTTATDVYSTAANYTYKGTAAQVTGNALPNPVNSLTVNNSGGNVTLTNSTGATSALNLTQGDLSTGSGANLLTLQNATTCNGTTDVISLPGATGGVTHNAGISLPTGTPLCYGNPNNQLTINSGSSSALTVRLLKSVPAGLATAVTRNYQIIVSGSGLTTTARLHYLDSELNGNTESALEFWRAATAAGPFTNQGQTSRDGTNNWVEKTGVSDITLHGNWTFASPQSGTLTVNKTVVPGADPGLFNLRIDGATAGTGANQGNGGTTGAVTVTPGSHTVSETAGTSTTLADYDALIGGDCAADGTVNVPAGSAKVCSITNTRKPRLTVNKATVPTGDTGKFNLKINGTTYATDISNGGTTGAQNGTSGSNTFGETAGTGTTLADYTTVITGSGCSDNGDGTGTISLVAGDNKSCTITNTRKPKLTVNKVTVPAGDTGKFNLKINGTTYATDISNGGTTNAQNGTVGSNTFGETAGTGTTLVDYTTAITGSGCTDNGDGTGTISLAAGDNKTCTITNTRKPKLTVTKTVVPASDAGKFNLLINGTQYATNVGDGGSTGAQYGIIGANTASETAGTSTSLADYFTVFGGDCDGSGNVTLAAGDNKSCSITNTRKPKLTVTKTLVPASDTGLFNLFINGTQYATNVGDGGSTGAQYGVLGANTASETAGTSTNLSDYTTTFGGACDAGGNVTLVPGDNKTCTITNARKPKLTVNKVTNPTTDTGLFDLRIDGTTYATDQGNGGTTGAQTLTTGLHTVSELGGAGTTLADYSASFNGDCAPDGTITLAAGDNKVCTITNTKKPKLTVNKATDPTTDTGLFNLQIDGTTAGTGADQGNGGTTGAVTLDVISQPDGRAAFGAALATGQSFTATTTGLVTQIDVRSRTTTTSATLYIYNGNNGSGTPGSVGTPDYTQGSVSLTDATGDGSSFGFSSIVLTTPFAVTAGNQYSFVISGASLSGEVFNNPYAGGTKLDDYAGIAPNSDIAFQVISTHTVGETAGSGTNLSDYTAVISGDCAADGTISLHPGDVKTCLITNTRKGSIKIVKNTTGGDDTFNYSVAGPNSYSASPSITTSGGTGNTTLSVVPGTPYSVAETVPSGWDLTASSCDSGTPAGFTVPAGGTVTCTFTNVKKGHVVVTKVTDPVDNSVSFSLHAEGTGTITPPANRTIQSGTPQDFEVTPGTYRVGELAQAGWDQTSNTCQGLVVAAGATVPCTITNTKKGSIKLVKNTTGGDTTFNYTLAGPNSYSASPSVTTSGGTGDTTLNDISAGAGYSAAETVPAGWDLTASSCDNGTPASFSVPAGGTVTCTFTNVKKGHVVVTKVTDPVDNSVSFSLHAEGTGTITPPANRTIQSGTPQDFEVTPGTYRVAELAQAGWDQTGNTCHGLVVAAGATVPCTITNTKKGSIKIVKNTSGGDDTFNYTLAGPNSYSATPSVTTTGGTGDTTLTDVSAGAGYSASETVPAGWDLTASSCDNGTPASFSVPAGGTVTCTFTNVKKGHLVVQKTTNPSGDPQSFSILASGTGTITGGGAGSVTDAIDKNYEVTPGTYSVSETVPAGWDQNSNTCSGVVVGAGETQTCLITNTKKGHVVVTKVTNPAGDPTVFSLHAEGTGTITPPANRTFSTAAPADFEVTPGTYRVAEFAQAGWDITGNTCQGLSVAAGATVNCTITNTKKGHVTVTKTTDNGDNSTAFTITASGTGTISPPNPTTITAAAAVSFEVTPGTYAVTETPLAGWVMSSNTCSGLIVPAGGAATCTIANKKDDDGDGIPNSVDCDPLFKDDVIVDPGNVVPPTFNGIRVATLQAAVNAASDNNVISMYANTTENVIIGGVSSGGKDLRIVGCGHKITSANPVNTNPVITIQVSAGKNDGDTGQGEKDIHIDDLSVTKGSVGIFIQTSKASTNNTGTLLKSIRSDANVIGIKLGATGAGNAVTGNEIRGANSIGTNTDDGIQVFGSSNVFNSNRVMSNNKDGIDVTGDSNTIVANSFGEKGTGNKNNGILVAGNSNTINENDVFGNTQVGIKVTGNMNLVFKNDVGEKDKGNGGGGILITGNNNMAGKTLNENNVFANTGIGVSVVGNTNLVSKNDVGDTGKGNTGIGIKVAGFGNEMDQNAVFANGGDGMSVSGSTAAAPNRITNNNVGDSGKGNGGDGIMAGVAADVGNQIHDNTIYSNTGVGLRMAGASAQVFANTIGDTGKGNVAGGIVCTGTCNTNVFGTAAGANSVFGSSGATANGMTITGNDNTIFNNNVGDSGKGNTGDGINVNGNGNTINQNTVYANGKLVGTTYSGDGIDVSGGTAAKPNVITNNIVGSGGKGNFGNGILVAGVGTGTTNPIEINGNMTRSNGLAGISVTGTQHQLANNVSGGSGAYPGGQNNRKCEFLVGANNYNAGGNTANGVLIPGAVNSAFPTTCQGDQVP